MLPKQLYLESLDNVSCYKYFTKRQYVENGPTSRSVLRHKLAKTNQMYRHDLIGHYGCVNAIEFSNGQGQFIASGGDDRRVLIWNVEKSLTGHGKPVSLKGEHNSNIFCVAFDNENQCLYSGGNDEQVVYHDFASGETKDVFLHPEAVYSVSVNPDNSAIFASACDDGKVRVFDTRLPPSEEPLILASYTTPMHAVMYNPMEDCLLATANSKEGLGLWDVRKPKSVLLRYGGNISQQSCMSVRFSRCGQKLIALRRRLPPILYHLHSSLPVFQFDHSGYYNSCTMKTCCFAGESDQYVLSGSDNFKLYMWKIPEKTPEAQWVGNAHLVMEGHRSIVNQVRYNPANSIVISSGVEKSIKMWSPFRIPLCGPNIDFSQLPERPVYTHEEYINLVLNSGYVMTHDQTQQTTSEDPRMMAFFDSLVQRELEGWSSDESLESSSEILEREAPVSDSSSTASDDDEADLGGCSPFSLSYAAYIIQEQQSSTNEDTTRDDAVASQLRSSDDTVRQDNVTVGNNVSNNSAEPPLNADDNQDVFLPGQSPNASRQRISDMILQKRKDYIKNANRKQKIKSRAVNSYTVQASSDDDGSVPSRRHYILPEANNGASTSQVMDIIMDRTKSKQKTLRELRQRLRDEEGIDVATLSQSIISGSSLTNTDSDDEVGSTNGVTCTTLSSANTDTLKHPTQSGEQASNTTVPTDSNQQSCDNSIPTQSRKQSANAIPTDSNEQPSNDMTAGVPNEPSSHNAVPGGSGEQFKTTWSEFCKFKHRVEKARRQYRRENRDNSSSDSD